MRSMLPWILTVCILHAATGQQPNEIHNSPPPCWPQFRGPNGSGVSDDAHPPVRFRPAFNVRWKTEVPSGVVMTQLSQVLWADTLQPAAARRLL